MKTGELIGEGIYCTPKFRTAEAHTSPFNVYGTDYRIIMMCKVCPKAVKFTDHPDKYWVVNKQKYIRVYALLIKQEF